MTIAKCTGVTMIVIGGVMVLGSLWSLFIAFSISAMMALAVGICFIWAGQGLLVNQA